MYSKFVNVVKDSTNHKILAWIDDLQMEVTESEWKKKSHSSANIINQFQYNWIMTLLKS